MHTMTAYIAIDCGERPVWLTLCTSRDGAMRAEVREAREFRDKMANAIGNDQLRRFIEKHGEPVPLTIRMQQAEARADRLAEALRGVMHWDNGKSEWDEARAALAHEDRNG